MRDNVMCSLFAFGLNPMELIVLGLVVLLLFGSRLPGVMRSLGQGVVEFKKGIQGVDDDEEDQALLKNKAKKNIKEEKAVDVKEEEVAHSKV
jgi:sec-independent protein translocase protein TatA